MIVITGPGRSGTSALGLVYRELGFDPGGNWLSHYNAGLEHGEFWQLNNQLTAEMRATMLHPRRQDLGLTTKRSLVRLMRWDRLAAVVVEHRAEMVRLAAATPVVKDPRFIFTLPLWLAADAAIEHVVVTTRALDDVVASRLSLGQSEFSDTDLRNSLTYGMGIAAATLLNSDLSHAFIRFPNFLTDIDGLYASLRFPAPTSIEEFREVATRVLDPGQVHDWSGHEPAVAPGPWVAPASV